MGKIETCSKELNSMIKPTWNIERACWKNGYERVVGIDEAGRGPLAGPVVAAAVCVSPGKRIRIKNLRDSKLLSAIQREQIWEIIANHPDIQWAIGEISENVIDKVNIYQATKLAMKQALENLKKKLANEPDFLILDGITLLDLPVPQKAVPHGDAKVASCAAASIIAKVTRDRLMMRYHELYPEYGFDRHKGYATAHHLEMLGKYGPSPIHRRSFAPLALLA